MRQLVASTLALALCFGSAAAADAKGRDRLPPASFVGSDSTPSEKYVIGALDQLNVFVWRNADLGGKVQVRPDGMITTPLIPDLQAEGKTPAQLADDIRLALTKYVDDPRVTVMVESFQGSFSQQIRVVGATEKPASLPYRANMTLLDAMIAVGGLSEYAAGNKARLIRQDKATGTQKEYDLKIARLLKKGDTKANVRLEPGDVIIIPESMF
ncbi:MAG TPA: XrtA/PEP-CTERM system exopolysaccharide export protein [Allosphingosinicella sp.]|jgi:polysaccharide export outer membrane protein|nr:XrtA/PEP-CTERM system exopolysaccharide export protein [Allosphingosinicella sp.]